MLFQVLEERRLGAAAWALVAEQGQEPGEGASGSVPGVGNGNREGALCPAELPHPLHPAPLSSHCCQMFVSGDLLRLADPWCCAL